MSDLEILLKSHASGHTWYSYKWSYNDFF